MFSARGIRFILIEVAEVHSGGLSGLGSARVGCVQ